MAVFSALSRRIVEHHPSGGTRPESLIRQETRAISSCSFLCLISGPPPSYVGDPCAEVQARGGPGRSLSHSPRVASTVVRYRSKPSL